MNHTACLSVHPAVLRLVYKHTRAGTEHDKQESANREKRGSEQPAVKNRRKVKCNNLCRHENNKRNCLEEFCCTLEVLLLPDRQLDEGLFVHLEHGGKLLIIEIHFQVACLKTGRMGLKLFV